MNRTSRILHAYYKALGHNQKRKSIPKELISQEERVLEQRLQAQNMANKITELQTKQKTIISTLDGRTLLI